MGAADYWCWNILRLILSFCCPKEHYSNYWSYGMSFRLKDFRGMREAFTERMGKCFIIANDRRIGFCLCIYYSFNHKAILYKLQELKKYLLNQLNIWRWNYLEKCYYVITKEVRHLDKIKISQTKWDQISKVTENLELLVASIKHVDYCYLSNHRRYDYSRALVPLLGLLLHTD